jgi:hypothetical protein
VTRMRVPLAIAAALAIVLGGAAVTLSQRAARLTGSNAVVERSGVSLAVPGRRGTRCQDNEHVPADTGRLRLFLNTIDRAAGPLEVTLATGGRPGVPPRVVARATLPYPFRTGSHELAVTPRFATGLDGARVCFVNRGRSAIALSGNRTAVLGSGANPYRQHLADDPRVDYLYPEPRSWWAIAGTIAKRFGLVKTSFFGTWTMWAVFAALALLWIAVVALLLRVLPRT